MTTADDRSAGALNAVCPVCGTPIASDLPPIELTTRYGGDHEQGGSTTAIALCSMGCIDAAIADPDRFVAAARREIAARTPS